MPKNTKDDFFKNVFKTKFCWFRIGSKFANGYGRFHQNHKALRAHRFSWTLHNGKIPEGLIVCHECDNPLCVNPKHLWLGTNADNNIDTVKKGRHKNQYY